jgi:hypothetical protein
METVTVSPKFQVVIPRKVREELGIELVPVRSAKAARGFLRGIDTYVEREPDRV